MTHLYVNIRVLVSQYPNDNQLQLYLLMTSQGQNMNLFKPIKIWIIISISTWLINNSANLFLRDFLLV